MQKLLTPSELAEFTGLALQTIYNRHSTSGSLPPCIKLGNPSLRLLGIMQTESGNCGF